MFNISDSIKISRPVSDVYNFTAELCNLPRWQKAVEYIEGPDGPARVGSRYTESRQFMGQQMRTTYNIADVRPNSHLGLDSEGGMLKLHVDMDFQPDGKDTRVSTTIRGEANGMGMGTDLDEKQVQRLFEKEVKDDSRELKTILEKKM